MQEILWCEAHFDALKEQLPRGASCLVVGGSAYRASALRKAAETWLRVTPFSDYSPNPKTEEVEAGIRRFSEGHCACILAVGGGSALDVAKAIRAYIGQEDPFLKCKPNPNNAAIPLVAVPTTAGTGAESTRVAILYRGGEKLSVPTFLPDAALLWEGWTETLPQTQRVATLLDALCQAIESAWSVRSDPESESVALLAIRKIAAAKDRYLSAWDAASAREIMEAASLSGQAIDRTGTTAAHAMCYRLTTEYGVPHGAAVALTLPRIWEIMLQREACNDVRGRDYVAAQYEKIARAYGADSPQAAIRLFSADLKRYGVTPPRIAEADLCRLAAAVDPSRLALSPAPLSKADLAEIYRTL